MDRELLKLKLLSEIKSNLVDINLFVFFNHHINFKQKKKVDG